MVVKNTTYVYVLDIPSMTELSSVLLLFFTGEFLQLKSPLLLQSRDTCVSDAEYYHELRHSGNL